MQDVTIADSGLHTGRRPFRRLGALVTAGACLGLGYLYFSATDFPTTNPIERVDAPLLRMLRENPGRHFALSPSYRLEAPLELRTDPLNQWIYGTEIDLREAIPRRAIHIQKKGTRAAIHADNFNPAAGLGSKLLHGTFDVPVIPLIALALLGVVSIRRRSPARPGRPGAA